MASAEFSPAVRPWARIDGVDLLRGLAIFFVLMNHVNMQLLGAKVPYTQGLPAQLVSSLVWNGQFGVQIFFAISGFLITSTTLRRWGSPAGVNVREFYLLRFARIGPLLLLLLAVLSVLHLGHVERFVVSHKTGGLGRALLAALTFHINLLEARRGYLPPSWDILWSLSVEEMFYLFFPLACRLFRRGRFLLIPLLTFVLVGPFARARAFNPNPVWREYSYLGGMDAIALGCLTALFLARRRLSRGVLWALGSVGVALLVFSLGFSIRAYLWGLGRNGLNMTILAVGACMVIAVSAQTEWRAPRILRPLLALGRRSYEVYLTHVFVVLGLFFLFVLANKPMRAVPMLFIGVVILAGVFGEIMARGYSEPMNRWLRRRWGRGVGRLGSVVGSDEAPELVESRTKIL
ncbi:acyltransferase [Granulicella sp. dw_53]|uniref:acyltransferase family protein n=1 Tax=Granulicella sp. dw_53 TaxID=2719792 RepID=UPI001BD474E4|nr:acyltransferase [Granulicella sp. dw_53]